MKDAKVRGLLSLVRAGARHRRKTVGIGIGEKSAMLADAMIGYVLAGQISVPSQGSWMHCHLVIIVERDVIAKLPVRLDDLREGASLVGSRRHRLEDRIGQSQELFEGFAAARRRETPEDKGAACREFDRDEPRVELARGDSEIFLAHRNAERDAFAIVSPVMIRADNGTIAPVFCSKRMEAVRTAIVEGAQVLAEPLHENQTRPNGSAYPVAVAGNFMGQPEEGPDPREHRLLAFEHPRVSKSVRPIGFQHCCPLQTDTRRTGRQSAPALRF